MTDPDLIIALSDEDAQAVHVTVTDVLINWGEDIEPSDREALRTLLRSIIEAKVRQSQSGIRTCPCRVCSTPAP